MTSRTAFFTACALSCASVATAAVPGALLITQFRLSGPNGPNDEFIEIVNTQAFTMAVAGFAIVSSDGVVRCVIPAATTLPAGGFFLCVNSLGYSLSSYPAGSGATATGNATYASDIPDNMGIALFDNSVGNYALPNRFDAVGSTSETHALYKEGAGYPPVTAPGLQYALLRRITYAGARKLVDANANEIDFIFVDTAATNAGFGQLLGAPSPHNSSSPRFATGPDLVRIDQCRHADQPPNLVRDHTSDPAANATFGTVDIRRTFTNTLVGGGPITRLRFRIIDITAFPSSGVADLRATSSSDVVATVDRAPCGVETSDGLVRGTTLEQPPNQPNGGGFNSTLSVDSITAATPLAFGASVDVRLVFGIQQTGSGRVCIQAEVEPRESGGSLSCITVDTNGGTFSNTTAISIPASGTGAPSGAAATPYPSTIAVANVTGRVTKVTVTLKQITHTRASDLDVLLVGPTGARVLLMSDVIDGGSLTGQSYTFDTAAPYLLPATGPSPTSGIFKPTNYSAGDEFPSPAPAGPYEDATSLIVFKGIDPNGTWSLYVVDDEDAETGTIAGGWEINISTSRPSLPLDFNGDGVSDLVLFDQATGQWDAPNVVIGSTAKIGFVPVPGDYDGNGRADPSMFRPGFGEWFLSGTPPDGEFAPHFGWAGDIPVPADYLGAGRSEVAVYRPDWSGSQWLIKHQQPVVWGLPGDIPVPGDYDGDLSVDIAVYRPLNGTWFIRNGATIVWGLPGDVPVPADYDGDGATDIAVFRPSTGEWFVRGQFTFVWGIAGDIPVPADYTGDGRADVTVYRPRDHTWYVNGLPAIQRNVRDAVPVGRPDIAGDFSIDLAMDAAKYVGDFDGNGTTDIAVYRPSSGTWHVRDQGTVVWGVPGDIPVAGDYDGDGRTDRAVFRPANGTWYVQGGVTVVWGAPGDIPVPADYNGDGVTDFAVYRPSDGMWYVKDQFAVVFGAPGDIPVPADYNGDGTTDVTVYRPANSTWFARDLFTIQWYDNTDSHEGSIPVPGDYDGDGVTDLAIYDWLGRWFIRGQATSISWGLFGDRPVPGDYNGDGVTDIAVYRPSTGEWFVKDQFTVAWGAQGDIPPSPTYAPK
jgi:subtilisin-like proprotein convertase family protein